MKRALVLVLILAGAGMGLVDAVPPEEEKIEAVLTAVIEAYRSADYAAMGGYYAPDVSMVPADYAPPVAGWAQVEQRYRAAHANLAGVEMTRENTQITRRGNVAWAVYQWRFAGFLGRDPITALGHTTMILEKRGGRWLIVHNHTSALPLQPPPAPPATQPAAPPPGS